MLSRVLTLVDKFQFYIMGALLLSTLFCSVGWYATHQKVAVAEQRLVAQKADYEKQLEKVRTAQAQAEAKALRIKQEQEKKDYERQKEADATAAALRGKYDSILREYAEAQRAARRTNLSPISAAPQGSDRPGESPLFSPASDIVEALVIPYKDAQICAENTARLEAVQKWATNR